MKSQAGNFDGSGPRRPGIHAADAGDKGVSIVVTILDTPKIIETPLGRKTRPKPTRYTSALVIAVSVNYLKFKFKLNSCVCDWNWKSN